MERATQQKAKEHFLFKDANIKIHKDYETIIILLYNWEWPSLVRVSGARLMTFCSPLSLPAHRCPWSNLTAQFHGTKKNVTFKKPKFAQWNQSVEVCWHFFRNISFQKVLTISQTWRTSESLSAMMPCWNLCWLLAAFGVMNRLQTLHFGGHATQADLLR